MMVHEQTVIQLKRRIVGRIVSCAKSIVKSAARTTDRGQAYRLHFWLVERQ